MASTPSTSLRLELMASGEQAGSWGDVTNDNLGTLLEQAICGYTAVYFSTDTDKTLTINNYILDESRSAVIDMKGTISVTRNVFAPAIPKVYVVKNSTTGGQSIVFKVAGSTGITVPNGKSVLVFFNGSDFEQIVPYFANSSTNADTLTGDQTNWATYRASAVANMLGWKNFGSGNVVFDASNSTSPTGSAVSNTDAATTWAPTYPTLMGWNGSTTFGVRVDSAKSAEKAYANTFDINYNGAAAARFSTPSTTTLSLVVGGGNPITFYQTGVVAAAGVRVNGVDGLLSTQGPILTMGDLGYYGVGTGGVITQGSASGKATGVTLSKRCGTITMDNASLAADTAVTFTFSNTTFDASDNIILNVVAGTNGAYCVGLDAMNTNNCKITLRNLTAGALAEAVQLRFTIIKSVNT